MMRTLIRKLVGKMERHGLIFGETLGKGRLRLEYRLCGKKQKMKCQKNLFFSLCNMLDCRISVARDITSLCLDMLTLSCL